MSSLTVTMYEEFQKKILKKRYFHKPKETSDSLVFEYMENIL